MPETIERRQCPRLPVEADVGFRRRCQIYYPIAMSDLTPQGCRVVSRERLVSGETIWVQLESLESLSGSIQWANEWQSGIQFDRPMHPAVFDLVAGKLAPAND